MRQVLSRPSDTTVRVAFLQSTMTDLVSSARNHTMTHNQEKQPLIRDYPRQLNRAIRRTPSRPIETEDYSTPVLPTDIPEPT